MPKKIVSTIWECDICGDEFESRSEALKCERQGIFAPAVHMGQMVDVRYPNGETHEAMVCHIHEEYSTFPFLHEGPLSYMICLENGAVRPVERKLISPKTSIYWEAKQPPNVANWDAFWRMFRRDDPDMRKRVQEYLRTHGAEYALRRGKLKFKRGGTQKAQEK